MIRHILAAAAAAGLATFAAGAAGAATTIAFIPYQSVLNPGELLVTDFDSPLTTAPGFALSGTGSFLTGTSGDGAAPAFSPVTDDPTRYLSVLGGAFEILSTPALREISFYIGSLDTYNTISFTGPGGFSQSFSGTQLNAATLAFDQANGNQSAPTTNGRYTFVFSQAVTGVRLDSAQNSFEISNIGAIAGFGPAGVPEPASWALMILGFGGVGSLLRRRRTVAVA